MNNISKKRLSVESALMLIISVIIAIAIVILFVMGAKAESIIAGLVGLSVWVIKILVNEHFKEIDRKADQQHQILLQGIEAGYDFKQTVMKNMYKITNELWSRSIWIIMNWNSLWPGGDRNTESAEAFNAKYDEYNEFLKSNAINIPSNIYTAAGKLTEGINTYKHGRMLKGDKSIGEEYRSEGHREMSKGVKLIKSSGEELFRRIREEFGLERLPGEVLNIPVPDES